MFNPDDLEPRKSPAKPRDLQPMSIEELNVYIQTLEHEIARVEAMITSKQAHRGNLDALFGGSKE